MLERNITGKRAEMSSLSDCSTVKININNNIFDEQTQDQALFSYFISLQRPCYH